MANVRKETDSLGVVEVPGDKLWGAQTQRSLEHFSIGKDLIPREMITAYAILKKAAATANHADKRLHDQQYNLIVQTCDEILAGQHHEMFPLHVWMTGSGTQFNMNVNEVISNRCCQLAGTPLGSKTPVHPNDHVNMAQSSNDSFPSAMYIAAALNVKQRLIPAVTNLRDAIHAKAHAWGDIVKIGRTHMQDATPLTLGQEWSGYEGMLTNDLERIETALQGVYHLALGGTAVGTGMVEGLRDLLALHESSVGPDAIIIPKCESADEIRLVASVLDGSQSAVGIVPMVELARAVFGAHHMADAHERVCGLFLGGGDLAADLGAEGSWDNLLFARSRIVAAAATTGIASIDVPYFKPDGAGLEREATASRKLGMTGKAALHAEQLSAINTIFTPPGACQ